jgi:TonB family protein
VAARDPGDVVNKSWWRQFEGEIIDDSLRLNSLLGAGGFGGVFLSDHVVEGRFVRKVALKLIASDAAGIERQLVELIAGTTLSHPSLLSCFHAGATSLKNMRLLYLVMELAEEGLQTRLEHEVLPVPVALDLTLSLAQALAYLHRRKHVHRDVKPANVLRVDGVWKLSDYGAVRHVNDTTSRTNLISGTMTYMPPESFDGVVSPAWDMWSLGVLLLRALTGSAPYTETSEPQLMHAILCKEPSIPAGLPAPFDVIVRGCLEKDFRARWTSEKVQATLDLHRLPIKPIVETVEEPAAVVASDPLQSPSRERTGEESSKSPNTKHRRKSFQPWKSPLAGLVLVACLGAAAILSWSARGSGVSREASPSVLRERTTAVNQTLPQASPQSSEGGITQPSVKHEDAVIRSPHNGKALPQPTLPRRRNPKPASDGSSSVNFGTPESSDSVRRSAGTPPLPSPALTPYRVGGGVSTPVPTYMPAPAYSEEARAAKLQGTVLLYLVVDERGAPHNVRILRSIGMGLDQRAIEALQKWKFHPGMRDGYPVPVEASIEVSFRLM